MGLAITVGFLADQLVNDQEGAEWFSEEMDRLNQFLQEVNLPVHKEPEKCEIFSCDMYGYSGIHYLRRIAAHFNINHCLPPPGNEETGDISEDPSVQEYYRLFENRSFLDVQTSNFDHLLQHSDCEGYYIPQDFPSVLFPPDEFEITGGMVCSSHRLKEECARLATLLDLPLTLDPEDDLVWEAADSQGQGETKWQKYGIESYCCIRLYKAAEHSIKTGAAIVFC